MVDHTMDMGTGAQASRDSSIVLDGWRSRYVDMEAQLAPRGGLIYM